ncbi:MAG: DUF971 domain-containing protein [Myxococcota bacterium]
MGIPHPIEVRYVDEELTLYVTYSDGLEAAYPTVFLRGYCPCARCQGHGGGPPKWVQPMRREQVTVENVTPVGTYAMSIIWGDGHDTGIYTFESLREMWRPGREYTDAERQLPGG